MPEVDSLCNELVNVCVILRPRGTEGRLFKDVIFLVLLEL